MPSNTGHISGLVSMRSDYDTKTTMDRLEQEATARGLKVFARIDHAAGAASVDKVLRPTELLIFGNPQGGTPLMEISQSAAIDLPLKAIAWEDEQGQTWLSYNTPEYIAQRHAIRNSPVVEKITGVLEALCSAATEE